MRLLVVTVTEDPSMRVLRHLTIPELLDPLSACSRLRAASTHILIERTRSSYMANIRPPFTSDLAGEHERAVARLYGIGVAQADRYRGESELLSNDADWRDVFDLLQPQARLHDLVAAQRPDLDGCSVAFGLRRVALLVRGRTYAETARGLGDTLEAIATRLCA